MSLFGHNRFYFEIIRKSIDLFGTVFNDMYIERRNSSNGQVQLIKVPIQLGPKDPAWVRTDADPNITRPTAIVLPRMSFSVESLTYNPSRKLNTSRYTVRKDSADLSSVLFQYNPVPYDIVFKLNIYANETNDGLQIIEQILPFFTPEFTVTINIIPELDIEKDIPIVLLGIENENVYEGDFKQRRGIIWTLSFKMNTSFYGPIVSKKVIKLANTNLFVGNTTDTDTVLHNITITPGLDANGVATSNADNSIPSANIAIDDPFGYIITTNTYLSNT